MESLFSTKRISRDFSCVVVLRGGRRGDAGDDAQSEEEPGEETERFHQNACPIPA